MNDKKRAQYVKVFDPENPNNQWPLPGTYGYVWRSRGFWDPESLEYEAWTFWPDDSDEGCVCDEFDFDLL